MAKRKNADDDRTDTGLPRNLASHEEIMAAIAVLEKEATELEQELDAIYERLEMVSDSFEALGDEDDDPCPKPKVREYKLVQYSDGTLRGHYVNRT